MNKKVSLGAAITFAAIIAAVTFIITMYFSMDIFNSKVANIKTREQIYKKISEVDALVRQNYDGTLDEDLLLGSISDGYINGMDDDYARYLSAEELNFETQEAEGNIVGIGITCQMDESGYMKIVKVIENSPAQAAKLQAGDLIVKVGDSDVVSIGYANAVEQIKGTAGTKVKVTARRNGKDLKQIELIRKYVQVPSIEYRMIETNGYIKITDFNSSTVEEFDEAVSSLTKSGAKALIFDLRSNGGGTLDSVTKILDKLLPEGNIVTATYKDGKTETLAVSDVEEINLPMVTLINSETASASELFVAALNDYNKAESVGTTSFGKGVLQTTYTLSDGSGLRFTTAHFNPPSGTNFDGVGITPDYAVSLTKDQIDAFDTLDETTDPQLMKAIDVANSKQQ